MQLPDLKQLPDSSELTTFDVGSIVIDRRLGSGSFASVYSFRVSNSNNESDPSRSPSRVLDISCEDKFQSDVSFKDRFFSNFFLFSSSTNLNKPHPCEGLALKTLHKESLSCPKKFKNASFDLQNEVNILSSLPSHPNIITLYGISSDFGTASQTRFLVVEQLQETLAEAIQRWRLDSQFGAHLLLLRNRRHRFSRESQAERMEKAALGTAKALKFLHSRNIAFRDLKPENLGFDKFGNVRLFDFALAQKLEPGTMFHERVGTLRYMAPEVVCRQRYDLLADVYSFGMVLWEICMLIKPYHKAATNSELECYATNPAMRPTLSQIASPEVKQLLRECLSRNPSDRPSFKTIQSSLRKETKLFCRALHRNSMSALSS